MHQFREVPHVNSPEMISKRRGKGFQNSRKGIDCIAVVSEIPLRVSVKQYFVFFQW